MNNKRLQDSGGIVEVARARGGAANKVVSLLLSFILTSSLIGSNASVAFADDVVTTNNNKPFVLQL